MKNLACPNNQCPLFRNLGAGSTIKHGFYQTRWGKRRRYRCRTCGKTFCSNTGTPYHKLQYRRKTFDEVAYLSIEGLNKSAIARVKRIAWNTVDRWLERAAGFCRRFNHRKQLDSPPLSYKQTRYEQLSAAKNSLSGSLLQLKSGLGFGCLQ